MFILFSELEENNTNFGPVKLLLYGLRKNWLHGTDIVPEAKRLQENYAVDLPINQKKIKPAVLEFSKEEKPKENNEVEETVKLYIDELAQTSLDDTRRILFLWEKTFQYRRHYCGDISDYFKKFIQLKTPLVVQLLELDFKLLGIADTNALEKKWSTLHLKVLKICETKKAASKILDEAEGVPKNVLVWRVFTYLFSPVVMSTGTKKPWKPSSTEQSHAFIT